MIEYAIIVASVAVAIILALNFVDVELSDIIEELGKAFDPEPRCVEVGSNCDKRK